ADLIARVNFCPRVQFATRDLLRGAGQFPDRSHDRAGKKDGESNPGNDQCPGKRERQQKPATRNTGGSFSFGCHRLLIEPQQAITIRAKLIEERLKAIKVKTAPSGSVLPARG